MKKLLLTLLAMMLILANCSAAQQVENQAFVAILGLDTDDNDRLEVIVQVPKIKGVEKEENQKDDAGFMVISTQAKTFSEGIELLSVALPRRINLSQVKMIVVSDALAKRTQFRDVMKEMAETYSLYATSYFVVCLNQTKDFIEAQQPIFSGSVTGALKALLEHHSSRGYVPISTFADVYYLSNSVYSDPIAILAASAEEGSSAQNNTRAPIEAFPDDLNVKSESKNEYAGGAVFRNSTLKCLLNARQMVFTNLVRGSTRELTYTVDDLDMTLQPVQRPKIKVDTSTYPICIQYEQVLQAKPAIYLPDKEKIEENLSLELLKLFAFCQDEEIEPFGIAERVTTKFSSLERWAQYNWHKQFAKAGIQVKIRIEAETSS